MEKFSPLVINLGGSIVAPDNVDVEYLKKLYALFLPYIQNGRKIVVIVGGGNVARLYQDAAFQIVESVTDEDKDWLGIHATRLNAHLLRTIFVDVCYPVVIDNPEKEISKQDIETYNLFIGSGFRPGNSTDYCTVVLAEKFNVTTFLTATAVPYVYDKDYNKYPDANIIHNVSWEQYNTLIADTWTPGMKVPIDPVASRKAQELGMSCHLLQGTNIENMKQYLDTGEFEGSVIHP